MPAADWRHAIEIHPPAWHCPAGPFWIAGWIAAPDGRAALDVRAWLGGRPQLGLAGLPRPDLATPHAGFTFLLHPTAGARELRLEVCDATGRWQEFHRQSLDVAPGAPPAEAPVTDVAPALLRLLAARRTHPGFPWAALATDALAAGHARPLDCLPNPPYFGALERPGATADVRYGRFVFTGWLAHRERSIVRLTAFVDPARPALLVHGLPHADVTAEFAGLRDATASRFVGYCEAPEGIPPPACLRIFAELDDGRTELVFARRIRPVVTTGADAGLPPLSRYTFWRAARALRAAARRLGWPWGGPAQVRAAERSAWDEFAALAPPPPARALRPARFAPAAAARPLTVTLVTHNLNREGAPLIALEYARHLAARPGWRVHVVSPQDGPLRAEFLAAGLPVGILDVSPLLAAPGPAEFAAAVAALPLGPAWPASDLIVANTMVAFWAVHLARRLGKPSILYVHESASVRNFFAPYFIPGLIPCIGAAFGLATRTVFSADAARAAHAGLERRRNFLVLPGWVDTARLGADGAAPGDDVRRAHGVPAGAVVFANIGSVSDRKGQLVLVAAVERLLRDRGDRGRAGPPLVFLIVGAVPSEYVGFLRDYVARRQLAAVQIIGPAADARPYFRAADIFVCASFEEALPRVVMEAAVLGLPIVSTAVNGIPEILGPQDAWLVPPGDDAALAAALAAALDARLQGDRSRAERARRKVREQFAADVLLPRHLALAAAVAAEPAV